MHILYLSLFFPIWMIEFHRKWKFWLRQLEEIDFLVSRTSSAASWWCAGSLEGVISSFQDYSQIDIDSCCTRIRICSNSIYWIDEWWYPQFDCGHIKGGLGGKVSLNFYSQENEEDTFVFLLWKTWYEFSLRFHRFQILQWAIAPGTTCLWIKDFEGNH